MSNYTGTIFFCKRIYVEDCRQEKFFNHTTPFTLSALFYSKNFYSFTCSDHYIIGRTYKHSSRLCVATYEKTNKASAEYKRVPEAFSWFRCILAIINCVIVNLLL